MKTMVLKVERPAYGGVFIGRHEGMVVMIRGPVLPGETVEAAVDGEKRNYLEASVRKILDPSPSRIDPACIYYGSCGGCSLQHVPHNMQVKLKEEVLKDCLKRIAKTDIEPWSPIISGDAWHYKIRAQFKISDKGIGFHRKGSRELVLIDRCPIMTREINDYIQKSAALFTTFRARELHLTSGDSLIAQLIARQNDIDLPDTEKIAGDLLASGLSGVAIVRGGNAPLMFGEPVTSLGLLDIKYTLSVFSFVQSSWELNNVVVRLIRDSLRPLIGKKILDLYAGAGNFAFPLSPGNEVVAVEGNPYAIEDGRRTAAINNITGCTFVHSSAENFYSPDHFDVAVLDPPRPGLSKRAMKNVLKMMPEKIVYLSCNPSTLARDLKKLSEKYEIESVRMIDFFPQTHHIEAITFLRLK